MQAPVKRGPDYPELSVGESTLDWEALAQDTLRKHQAVTQQLLSPKEKPPASDSYTHLRPSPHFQTQIPRPALSWIQTTHARRFVTGLALHVTVLAFLASLSL